MYLIMKRLKLVIITSQREEIRQRRRTTKWDFLSLKLSLDVGIHSHGPPFILYETFYVRLKIRAAGSQHLQIQCGSPLHSATRLFVLKLTKCRTFPETLLNSLCDIGRGEGGGENKEASQNFFENSVATKEA